MARSNLSASEGTSWKAWAGLCIIVVVWLLMVAIVADMVVEQATRPAEAAASRSITKPVWLPQGAEVLPDGCTTSCSKAQQRSVSDFAASATVKPVVFASSTLASAVVAYCDVGQDPPVRAERVVAEATDYQTVSGVSLDKKGSTVTVWLAGEKTIDRLGNLVFPSLLLAELIMVPLIVPLSGRGGNVRDRQEG
jgi:hypothetical protein